MREFELWAPLGDSYATTREHLHQVAFFAVSPARYREVGRMGLQPTPGGFGTPTFGTRVARVSESLLVLEADGDIATQEITDIRSAVEFFGGEYRETWFDDFHDPLEPMDPDLPLVVSPESSRRVGEWFAFAFEVLNDLRSSGTEDDETSEAQIWPEHFDAAAELGNADKGERASFGASPGDGGHAQPYLYVAPWSDIDKSDAYWNARHFSGSILPFRVLSEAPDPKALALEFYRDGYIRLHG